MDLQDLIEDLPLRVVQGTTNFEVRHLSDDSRRISNEGGVVFVARSGANDDGRAYVKHAVQRGATAVIANHRPAPTPTGRDGAPLTWIVGDRVDQAITGRLAERFYGHPSRRLKLIGVTGTNGKTTTCQMLAHLLRQAGLACGIIGTVFIDDGHRKLPAHLTTPGAIDLSRTLASMVSNQCAAATIEVSSHALHQGRTDAIQFDTAVFTNLTGDHLDYHRTIADYAAAKKILFDRLSADACAVINADDAHAPLMMRDCGAKIVQCSVKDGSRFAERCQASVLELGADYSRARFEGAWGRADVRLPMVGRHNVANALFAVAAASTVTQITGDLCRSLESCPPVPGRLEPVRLTGQPAPNVLVDYAHTPDALLNVLRALRPLAPGRLIVLFGCGGDRDRTKRPRMAAVACRWADQVVVTSDNPRTENPLSIVDDILAGVPKAAAVRVEPDRAKAIEQVIHDAQNDDTVLLAGKGHEPYQEIGTTRHHFDDREHAAEALRHRWGS